MAQIKPKDMKTSEWVDLVDAFVSTSSFDSTSFGPEILQKLPQAPNPMPEPVEPGWKMALKTLRRFEKFWSPIWCFLMFHIFFHNEFPQHHFPPRIGLAFPGSWVPLRAAWCRPCERRRCHLSSHERSPQKNHRRNIQRIKETKTKRFVKNVRKTRKNTWEFVFRVACANVFDNWSVTFRYVTVDPHTHANMRIASFNSKDVRHLALQKIEQSNKGMQKSSRHQHLDESKMKQGKL